MTAGSGTGSFFSVGCAVRLWLASTTKLNVVFKASAAIKSTCKTGFSFLFLFMMPSSRKPLLVFLLEGGDGGLRRWSLLTPLVEAPTGDIISSSLNGFSLRVFSGSELPELDIFRVRKGLFLKGWMELGVLQDSGEKDFLFFAIIEVIFDRFQLFAWKQVRPRDQFIHEKSFKPFFAFGDVSLFFAP